MNTFPSFATHKAAAPKANDHKADMARPQHRNSRKLGQLLVLGGGLLLLFSGSLQPHVAAIRTPEGLYIPNNHYKFPQQEVIQKNQTLSPKLLSHTFTLYNGRTYPIQVAASADCGCTGISWNKATIPPLGRKSIVASMKASKHSATVGLTFDLGNDQYAFASLKQ